MYKGSVLMTRETEQLLKMLFKVLPLVIVELKHFSLQGYSTVGLHSLNPGKAFWHSTS